MKHYIITLTTSLFIGFLGGFTYMTKNVLLGILAFFLGGFLSVLLIIYFSEWNSELNKKQFPLSYQNWYDQNEEEIIIKLAETGADRELDFDSELEFDKMYEEYLKSFE